MSQEAKKRKRTAATDIMKVEEIKNKKRKAREEGVEDGEVEVESAAAARTKKAKSTNKDVSPPTTTKEAAESPESPSIEHSSVDVDAGTAGTPTATTPALKKTPATKPTTTFTSLCTNPPLDARLVRALHKLKIDTPTPVQRICIPLAFEGKNMVVRAPTGTGKTGAYLIPVLERCLRDAAKDSTTTTPKGPSALILLPTRELAAQVRKVCKSMTKYLDGISLADLTSPDFDSLPTPPPAILIATPSKLMQFSKSGVVTPDHLSTVRTLVIDEADLVLRFGHADDLADLVALLPSSTKARVQKLLFSATMDEGAALLPRIGMEQGNFENIDVPEERSEDNERVTHHVIRLPPPPQTKLKRTELNHPTDPSSFLLLMLILKLKLSPFAGRTVVYLDSPLRAFKLRLFLEQFGVRGVVLDASMPARTRVHKVEEFNRGVYDLLFATDGGDRGIEEEGDKDKLELENPEEEANSDNDDVAEQQQPAKKKKKAGDTSHYSRGLDFLRVRTVVNLDPPPTAASYIHRAGRTGRGPVSSEQGHVLTFLPSGTNLPTKIEHREFVVDKSRTEGWKYRVEDALRSVTTERVQEARRQEIKRETIASEKLKSHFDSKPQDLHLLRHDKPLHQGRGMAHLKHVPVYLLPEGARPPREKKVWAPFRKPGKDGQKKGGKKRERDPMKSFKA